ncbi:hypothetical protein FE783_32295 [Paenibacillus mesophilus]|uniref:hypothetical protein n=1 Tax=Paenibacillus mesophilus TaxID=2582849 RepID=UPI00110EB798|nr:hypothetical protein [Paenibacillus mesophilus]TMV44473.1 hypothetical protein FE783_32295 [Paenibacillus mesophilus]
MSIVYFKDNFFSSGETQITDSSGGEAGFLNLHSMFGSGITVHDNSGRRVVSGKFRMFSNAWIVADCYENEVGVLRPKFAFFKQRYVYTSNRHGEFTIESPAFSKEYVVCDSRGNTAAYFRRTSGMFSAGAYELNNSSSLTDDELIAVVMGVYAIIKRQQSAAAT